MARKKDIVARWMKKEMRERKRVPFRPLVVRIRGRRWENVGRAKHGVGAVLMASYWRSMGFAVRIRRLKGKQKFSVDIRNFVTSTDFPTQQKIELAKKGKHFKVIPRSYRDFVKRLRKIF